MRYQSAKASRPAVQPDRREQRPHRPGQDGEVALTVVIERREARPVERGEAAIMMPLLLDHGVDAAHQCRAAGHIAVPAQRREQALHEIGFEHHDVFVDADTEELIVA
jgi:hypothetical protein